MNRSRLRMSLAAALLLAVFLFSVFALSRPVAVWSADASAIIASLAAERAKKTQPIEDPASHMAVFYQALARTALKQPGAITRICHFGDSLIEMELVPGPARRLLQEKFGDSDHGFVLAKNPKPWYRPYDLEFKSAAEWISFDMGDRNVRDRRFGLGGAVAQAYKRNAELEVGTVRSGRVGKSVSRFEFLFPIEPTGGPLDIEIDGKKVGILNTSGNVYQEGWAEINVADGPHKLTVTARQEKTRLHGIILERTVPGVVYDALGINGSGVNTYLSVARENWINQLRHRNPSLVMIGIGTNDTYFELDISVYVKDLRQLLERVREALPNSTLLLVAPLDRAMKRGSELVTHPMTPKIVAAQRQLAKDMGIAFWSAFDAMGGEGSMARWYNASPRLGAGDFFHPTPLGGEKIGEMLYWAMMQGFARYLETRGLPTNPPPARPADPLRKLEIR